MGDDKDKLILFELLQDCRQPLSKIAKSVKLPQQTVSYRIKKLEKSNAIKKYTVNINYPKLGFSRHSLYLDLKNISEKEVGNYLKSITDIHEVSCCYMLHEVSDWKVYISVWTKTVERYDEIQTKIISKFRKYIDNYISFQGIRSYTYFARRLNKKKKAKVDEKKEIIEAIKLQDIDWKILNLLKKDSRKSSLEISTTLKTSVEKVRRRLKFLIDKKIILRFYPILNLEDFGLTEYTYILRIDPSYKKELDEFIEFAKKDPRFVIVIKAVGYVNLYYAFLSENKKELKEITSKVEKILKKAIMKTFKIEVEEMLS